MVRLLVVLVLLAGCGSNPPPPASSAPVANVAPPLDASVVSAEADADVGFVDTFGCCSQGHWTCGRTPLPGEGCLSSGGCCHGGGTWVCGRMPLPGECPGSGLP